VPFGDDMTIVALLVVLIVPDNRDLGHTALGGGGVVLL
jgi:hypothetical protein